MSRWYFLALAAIPLFLSFLRPPPQAQLVWWTTHALEKIHPHDAPPQDLRRKVDIKAARNEFEPFQIVLRAEGQPLDGVDVDVSDLRGSTGLISKDRINIYLETYLDLIMPSSIEGGTGEWPDPLIPRVDAYTHEKRKVFPFRIVKDRNQPVWIEVFVPPGTPAGSYRGTVQVTINGATRASIPVELNVWNFDLPSTSNLATTFGFSGLTAVRQHFGKYTTDKAVADITSLYGKSALLHRITLDGSSGIPPGLSVTGEKVQIDWTRYDAQVSPFLEGRVIAPNEPLYGAKTTTVTLHPPPSLQDPKQQIQYWQNAAAHFRQKGWIDRLYVYLIDEPKPPQFPGMAEKGRTIHRADPALKNLVTAQLHADWSDFIDIWTPTINCVEHRPTFDDYCVPTYERHEYDDELSRGKKLWWYQACGTHGCNIVGGPYFTGWPSYVIDITGIRARMMEWLTWKYDIGGELYFSVNEAYGRKDPWKDVYLFGGNGDGTLYYPGRPDVIGGTTHIPIESIRLKLIREGLEDYEYLTILSRLGGKKAAAETVNAFVRHTYDFDPAPEKLYAARKALAEEIVRRKSGSTSVN